MKVKELKLLVIRPTLQHLDLYSDAAENLLLGTCAQESACGKYLRQIGFAPESNAGAFGIYQMELATESSIWNDFLEYHPKRAERVKDLQVSLLTKAENLAGNLPYATAMARMKYLWVKDPLPKYDDIEGMARYWKRHYNTRLGKGTEEEFIENYNRYIING